MEFGVIWGARMKALCDERRLPIPELARRLGVHRSTAYSWMTGTEPTNDMKVRIAEELGVPARELFSLDPAEVS